MNFDMDVRSHSYARSYACSHIHSHIRGHECSVLGRSKSTFLTAFSTAILAMTLTGGLLSLLGCGAKPNQTISADSGLISKGDCNGAAITNRYIVRWKDGTTSIEDVESAQDFKENIAQPFADDIAFAETDFRIQIPKRPHQLRAEAFSGTPLNWGVNDSRANTAWAQGATGAGILVAVVDTGVDETHPQLAGQLYVNPNEIPANQLDDDNNGFIDDVNGYNFVTNTGQVTDGVGHGTHVSGIIAADSSKGLVQGMAPKAKILPLAFMDSDGGGTISAAIRAITYARAQGAKIVNASWGGPQCSKALTASISELNAHGILFISAAGNGDENGNGLDLGVSPEFPAALGMPNQITVGAITIRDIRAGFSNYSRTLVNLLAPGVGIVSTFPGGGTASMDGTSMATPFVSGAAAAIWSAYPNATASQVRAALLDSTDFGDFPVTSGGRLDVVNALQLLKTFVQK